MAEHCFRDDDEILSKCQAEKRSFVTYAMATVPDLLRRRASEEHSHSGVFFADENAVRPNHPG